MPPQKQQDLEAQRRHGTLGPMGGFPGGSYGEHWGRPEDPLAGTGAPWVEPVSHSGDDPGGAHRHSGGGTSWNPQPVLEEPWAKPWSILERTREQPLALPGGIPGQELQCPLLCIGRHACHDVTG